MAGKMAEMMVDVKDRLWVERKVEKMAEPMELRKVEKSADSKVEWMAEKMDIELAAMMVVHWAEQKVP